MSYQRLIFVYNADSGLLSTLADFTHRILFPSTYKCRLSTLTYGNFRMKKDWKHFLKGLPARVTFFYKDDFMKRYNIGTAFPAVYIKNIDVIRVFLTKKEIEHCKSLQELKTAILEKMSRYDQHHHSGV
jgi:hypothetical protein